MTPSPLVEINHPYACPPQWLPVLLAMHSKGADAAAQPTAAFAAAPSPPPPPPPPPCTPFRGSGAVSFPPDPNRCKVALKIEARLLSSLQPCTHLPPTHAYTFAARANRVRL